MQKNVSNSVHYTQRPKRQIRQSVAGVQTYTAKHNVMTTQAVSAHFHQKYLALDRNFNLNLKCINNKVLSNLI